MRELRTIANLFVTLGPVGSVPYAGLIAVLLALPVVYAVDALVWAIPAGYPLIYIALLVFFAAALAVVGWSPMEEQPPHHAIVATRILGMAIVFSGIPLSMKFLFTGTIFFLLVRHFLPQSMQRYAGIDCASWSLLASFLFIDCVSGQLVNFIFRFIFWLVTIPL